MDSSLTAWSEYIFTLLIKFQTETIKKLGCNLFPFVFNIAKYFLNELSFFKYFLILGIMLNA